MRLLLVDDHEVVRRGVRSLLLKSPSYEICGEAVDGQDAIEKASELTPDVIVMDISMPRLNGLEATRQVRNLLPSCEVLVLSQHEAPEMAREAFKAGARGYVVKTSIAKDLLKALDKVSRHEYFFDSSVSDLTPPGPTDVQEILQRSAAFEHALRESEELYRTTFEGAAVGVAHVSREGRWLRANRKVCEITGYTEAELLQRSFQEITHPDDLTADLGLTEKLLDGALQMFSMEKRYIRKDGSVIWVNLTVSGARDQAGKLRHFISVVEDITGRKRVEEALRDSQAQLALALESSETAMFDWDNASKRGSWNPQMAAIYGFNPKDNYITPEEWRSLFHPDDAQRLADGAERMWSDKRQEQFHFEFRTAPRDGKSKWILSHGRIVRDARGKAVRMIGTHTDITARKEVEYALQQRQEELKEAQRLANIGSWRWSPKTDTVVWSEELYRIAGRDPKSGAVSYENHAKLYTPESWQRLQAAVNEALANGTPYSIELELLRPDGTTRWVVANGETQRDSQGAVVALRGTVQDVTGRKKAEAERRKSEERFKAFFDLSAVGAARADVRTAKFLEVNDTFCRLTGYTPEELKSLTFFDLTHPDDRASTRQRIELKLQGKLPSYETDKRYVRKDGTTLWVHVAVNLVCDEHGQPYYVGVVSDISDRKRIEDELRENEDRIRFSLEAANIGTWEWDMRTGQVRWSSNMEAVHGQAPGSFGSSFESFMAGVFEEDRPAVMQQIQRALARGGDYHNEYRQYRADGGLGWMEAAGRVVFDESGAPVRMLGICANITDRKKAEEEYRKLAETLESEVRARTKELEDRNAYVMRQSEQLQDLSLRLLKMQDEERRHIPRELHDSAGQTLAVLGMNVAQLIQKASAKASEIATDAEMIQAIVEQLHREIRTTSYLLHPPLLDETGLPSALSWYVQGIMERSGMDINLSLAEDLGRLPADMELAIFRLVQECLTNIHRHSGSKIASIDIARKEGNICVEVRDRGRGIPPERLARIQSESSGVGIRGIRERLRQFRGEMNIESNGSGTRVIVRIPMPKEVTSAGMQAAV